jgi:peptidyl-tRNA hydrolase
MRCSFPGCSNGLRSVLTLLGDKEFLKPYGIGISVSRCRSRGGDREQYPIGEWIARLVHERVRQPAARLPASKA